MRTKLAAAPAKPTDCQLEHFVIGLALDSAHLLMLAVISQQRGLMRVITTRSMGRGQYEYLSV